MKKVILALLTGAVMCIYACKKEDVNPSQVKSHQNVVKDGGENPPVSPPPGNN